MAILYQRSRGWDIMPVRLSANTSSVSDSTVGLSIPALAVFEISRELHPVTAFTMAEIQRKRSLINKNYAKSIKMY